MFSNFSSTPGAIKYSVIGLLSFTAYTFLVSRYILENFIPGVTAAFIETLVVLLIVGVWVFGLLSSHEGGKNVWILLLICSLLPTLFTIYDLIYYSPIKEGWPLLQTVVWITFISNLVASVSSIIQIRN